MIKQQTKYYITVVSSIIYIYQDLCVYYQHKLKLCLSHELWLCGSSHSLQVRCSSMVRQILYGRMTDGHRYDNTLDTLLDDHGCQGVKNIL